MCITIPAEYMHSAPLVNSSSTLCKRITNHSVQGSWQCIYLCCLQYLPELGPCRRMQYSFYLFFSQTRARAGWLAGYRPGSRLLARLPGGVYSKNTCTGGTILDKMTTTNNININININQSRNISLPNNYLPTYLTYHRRMILTSFSRRLVNVIYIYVAYIP